MPASPDSPDRPRGKLLPALLWAGVGVAPLAALALVLGSGERSLRIAIGLALLSVVLIGLSVVLRPTVEAVKVDLEDALYDEVDAIRDGMRNDIATAARATHRSFGEKFEHLQGMVEQLRGQLEAIRVEMARQGGGGPTPHGAMGGGLGGPPRPNGAVPGGVVRHTETVQVTTRSTIVDPHSEEPPAGRSPWSGADAGRRGATVYGSRPEPAPSYEESWTEQQLRKRFADAEAARADASPAPDEDRWSGVRSGDRWASVRSDDRGRELRMGERRTSMHSDESGNEVRYEDRWASVRHDTRGVREAPDDRRWPPQPRDSVYGGPYGDGGRDSRSAREWDDRDWNARETGWENRPRALPSTSDEPSASEWVNRWSNSPEPERRRRYADDY